MCAGHPARDLISVLTANLNFESSAEFHEVIGQVVMSRVLVLLVMVKWELVLMLMSMMRRWN